MDLVTFLTGFINAMIDGNLKLWASGVDWQAVITSFVAWVSGLGTLGIVIFWCCVGNITKFLEKVAFGLLILTIAMIFLSKNGGISGVLTTLFN